MSDLGGEGKKARRGFLPYTYIVGRLLIVVPTLLIIVLICAGFAGWGPGHRLHGAAAVPAADWVTGKQPEHRAHRRRHRYHHHRHHHHGHSRKHHHHRHENRHHKGKKQGKGGSG